MRKALTEGFTLIEVMVALLIFSIVAATVIKSTSSAVQRQATLETRMMAQWLAANAIAEVRLARTPVTGRKSGDETFGGREWKVTREVVNTPNPFIKEIRVVVSELVPGLGPQQVATVTGYVGTH